MLVLHAVIDSAECRLSSLVIKGVVARDRGLALDGVGGPVSRSTTSTSSSTRRTAPLGPAQAYWPNTGLSDINAFQQVFSNVSCAALTWEQLVNSAVLRQQSVELSICGDHSALSKICIQTQAPYASLETSY